MAEDCLGEHCHFEETAEGTNFVPCSLSLNYLMSLYEVASSSEDVLRLYAEHVAFAVRDLCPSCYGELKGCQCWNDE